jgi:hypothetical protein
LEYAGLAAKMGYTGNVHSISLVKPLGKVSLEDVEGEGRKAVG